MWAKADGCGLKLAGANPRIRQLFELTNLLSVFDIHPTLEDALLSFQPRVPKPKAAAHAAQLQSLFLSDVLHSSEWPRVRPLC
jgi:hypothetical protein